MKLAQIYLNMFLLMGCMAPIVAASAPDDTQLPTFRELFATVAATADSTITRGMSDQEILTRIVAYMPDIKIGITELPTKTLHIGQIEVPYDRGILDYLYTTLIDNNHYKDVVAKVRVKDSLCPEEQAFLAKRNVVTKQALEKILRQQLPADKLPRIGVVISGGGWRAAASTEAFLSSLNQTGLLDAVTYIATLSGSTWTLGPWMSSGKSFAQFSPDHQRRLLSGILQKSLTDQLKDLQTALPLVLESFLRKMAFDESPTVIDLYGMIIALSLYDDTQKKNFLTVDLAGQIPNCKDGQTPLPIYTCLVPDKKIKTWIEFTPFTIGSRDWGIDIPSWALGRKFKAGTSTTVTPELPISFLMGIWGSAISLSFEDMFKFTLDKLEPKILFEPIKILAEPEVFGDVRLFPAELRNFAQKMDGQVAAKKTMLTLVDAGLDYCLPLPPMIDPNRHVDIILMLDISGDVADKTQLMLAEADARAHNLPFPKIDYTNVASKPFSIFDDGPGSNAPIVIYLPLAKNPNFSQSFDPQQNLGVGGFLNTLNFVYSKDQLGLVRGLIDRSVRDAYPTIVQAITSTLQRKK